MTTRDDSHPDAPTASVVIVTRNRLDDVRRAVSSALNQTVVVEVLVIDDASSDGTADVLRSEFPSIRVEGSERSIGCVAQRNRAMRQVSGDLVVVIDDDAYFASPRCVEQTVEAFDDPRIAVVTIPYVNVRREGFVRHAPPETPGAHAAGTFTGCASAFRREAFLAVGGYTEDLVQRGEEGDLALRLMASGYLVRVGRAEPVVHLEAAPVKSDAALFYDARNGILLAWLRVPRRYLVSRMCVAVAHAVRLALRTQRPGPSIRGLAAGVAVAWSRRAERRPVPAGVYALARDLRRRGPRPLEQVREAIAADGPPEHA